MLVLSRRLNEKILLPDINATLQIVTIKPGVVRIGFEGPQNVSIFREEIFDPHEWQQNRQKRDLDLQAMLRRLMHQIRNRLSSATIGMALLRKQLERGLITELGKTLDRIELELATLQQSLAATSSAIPQTGAVTAGKKLLALLVEDDPNECELLAGFLRLAGVDVATAGDGADALDYLRDHVPSPDFVLMDMSMPRCDGLTAARAIRENPSLSEVKIYAVTGLEKDELEPRGGPSPIDGWFQKPLNPELLLQELNAQQHKLSV